MYVIDPHRRISPYYPFAAAIAIVLNPLLPRVRGSDWG